MRRIGPVAGEWIDRSRPIELTFEGRRLTGFHGDTISSALLANGVRVLGRSFKYHRVRGVCSAANHDVNAMFQVAVDGRSVPNVRGDVEPLREGMEITAVNTVGGLERDRLAIMDTFSRFLPVGFYYKAFLGNKAFPAWERRIRAAAGLGRVVSGAGADGRRATAKRYAHADVLVIGAGVSGLAAALVAAEGGAQVILADEVARSGGSALYARGGEAIDARVEQLAVAVTTHPRIQFLARTFAAGYYADHWVALVSPECMLKVRARAVVIAQGVFEQPAVFRGNDLPGVMLASGAQRLLYQHAVAPASRVAVLTANEEGYVAALDAAANGIQVVGVLDLRSAAHATEAALIARVRARGIAVHFDVRPVEALKTGGPQSPGGSGRDGTVKAFEFEIGGGIHGSGAGRQNDGRASAARPGVVRWDVDGLWMSVGFAPANALLHQAGARMRFENSLGQFVPETLPAGVFACGKVAGQFGVDERLAGGREAGRMGAMHAGFAAAGTGAAEPVDRGEVARAPRGAPSHGYPIFPHPRGKEFIDFDEDLQLCDLQNAFKEGFDSSELLKRYSTVGMGPSQGKHSNMNALRVLAKLRGEPLEAVGTTTARPMFHPVPLSHLAGRGFYPQRRTALHAEHQKLGAVWMHAGDWLRPEYYTRPSESREASIQAEVLAVRNGVGIIDVGTLGKLEAHGTGAAEFLDRAYGGLFSTLKPGATRYGLLMDEAGVIVDDGVIARLGPEHFYFTTTTGNSATLFREFGRLATLWQLPVGLVNLTGHFAAFNVAGPAARPVLRKLTTLDLSHGAFPYLGVREAEIAGVRCRLMRVGFVGEIGYEIHLPARHATTVWHALMDAGKAHGIRPFGVEAQRILRLEKGHIIVGQDTDGLTHPLEIGAAWALRMNKPFFVGQRSLRILERKPLRQRLVGFRLTGSARPRVKESHLIIDRDRIAGRVTSVAWSPTLGHPIGLALVDPEVATRSELRIRVTRDEEIAAQISALPFYDESGERQRLEEAA